MTTFRILALSLLAAASVSAQQTNEELVENPAAPPVTEVTIILRYEDSNIPVRYTSYLSGISGRLKMPLHRASERGWVADIEAEFGEAPAPGRFILRIEDTNRLVTTSSAAKPLQQRPIEILQVELGLDFGLEIPVYKASDLAISVVFNRTAE